MKTMIKVRFAGTRDRTFCTHGSNLALRSESCTFLDSTANSGVARTANSNSTCTLLSCFNGFGCSCTSGCLTSTALHCSNSSGFNTSGH